MSADTTFLEELRWRGLLHQTAGAEALEAHLSTQGRIGYCGFDPTADSLTIGHLIPILLLSRWQRAGHKPIVLMGGGTGLIGDPSGKDQERQLLTPERVQANIEAQLPIFRRILDFDASRDNAAVVVNNADWLSTLGYIDMLRDVGKHFSVNAMMQKDSVRARLESREQGISYTEFSYSLLQAYDFWHLFRSFGCTVQIAGSDQYGNIVWGIDLIRRKAGGSDQQLAFGITAPLVTTADGKKIGKTEKGAVYLNAKRTSPYAFYQYWINIDDQDVERFLCWFTWFDRSEIDAITSDHAQAPHERRAQRVLARHMTELIHGKDELAKVEAASQALFGGEVRALDEAMLADVFSDVPHSEHPRAALKGEGMPLVDLLAETTLAKSKREARDFLSKGAVVVNGERADSTRRVTTQDLLHGKSILLRRGKKNWHATRWI